MNRATYTRTTSSHGTPALPADVRLMNMLSRVLLLACLSVGAAAALAWAVRHPLFTLERITVQGEVSRNNELTLKTNVVPKLQGNFFTINLDQVRHAFEAVPWVRTAQVRREFPNRLRVHLQEQQALALWGDEGAGTLVNAQGQVFEANVGEVEADALVRLKGPQAQSAQVLTMYQSLRPLLQAADMDVETLELSARGSWRLQTLQGASIELGRGAPEEVYPLLQNFLRTLGQVASRYGRTPKALLFADLRHKNGYALRLQGVTTTEPDARKRT